MRQRHCVSVFLKLRRFKPHVFFFSLCLFLVTSFPWKCSAQEPAREFIQALRDNGYYDLAIQYLDDVEKGSLIDDTFRKRIPLEKAETLIQSVNNIRDLEKWEKILDEAQQILSAYVAQVSDPELSATAQQYQANLSYRQGRVYLKRSELDRLTASEKDTQLANARTRFEKSLQEYLASQETLKKILTDFKVDPQNVSESTKQRDDLRRMYVDVKMRAPIVRETLADTFTDEAKKNEQLTIAAKEFADLWDKYYNHNRREALDSCYYAARTNFKLKKYKEALGFTEEILNLPHQANSRTIIRKGALVAIDCWKAMDPYPINQIIAALEPHIELLDRKSKVHPEWLSIQLELAKAYRARGEAFKKENRKPSEIARWNNMAAVLARTVSRSPSPVRDESRKLLTEWKISVDELEVAQENKPKTFLDAKEKTRELANEIELASVELSNAQSNLRAAKDETEIENFRAELDVAKQDLLEKSDRTLAMVQLSLELSDDKVPREDLNLIHYLQCYSYYASERYFESAIIGEFMLTKYPNVAWSQQASGLVVKSYSRLYDAAKENEKDFLSQQLSGVCDNIISRWPGSAEAISSASKLANIAINKKDFDEAQKYLGLIPSDNPARASIALKIGSNLWSEYLKDSPKDPNKLASVISMLSEGITSSDPNRISFTTAVGSLRLVQAHLENNDSEKALHQLEKAKIAPLDLIKQQHPAITDSQYRQTFAKEAYRTAINTYLATLQGEFSDEQLQTLINKCLGTLQSLKQILESEGAEGKTQLVSTYKVIAARLNNLFEGIEDPDKKIAMASSIGKLLGSLGKDGTDGRTVLWAGATTLEIADQLGDDAPEVRRTLYLQADDAFARSKQLGFAGDPEEANIELELGRFQALSKRGAGQYDAAVDALIEVLKTKPNYLQAQLDAAETLYLWGKAEGRSSALAEALSGKESYRDEKNKRRNRIWGWQQMVQMTNRNEKLIEVYYQVKLGHIKTMFEYWQVTNKADALNAAKRDIAKFRKRFPELGGDKWRAKFEALEQRINSEAK